MDAPFFLLYLHVFSMDSMGMRSMVGTADNNKVDNMVGNNNQILDLEPIVHQ
jgi:hypothetical protein